MTINKNILATCWTWAGDAAPARGDETSPVPIARRIQAVADTGWTGVNLVHADLATIRDDIGLPTLKTMLDDHGITTVEVEFITNWWTDGDMRRASDRLRDELFNAAAALGANVVKTGAELQSFGATAGTASLDVFAEKFDELATAAGQHGVRVALEPMPMSNITTINAGADFMRTVGNPHGGLVVDTWHVSRGGTPFADLRRFCRWSTSSSSSSTMRPPKRSNPSGTTPAIAARTPAKVNWAPSTSWSRWSKLAGPVTGAWRSSPPNNGRCPSRKPWPRRRMPHAMSWRRQKSACDDLHPSAGAAGRVRHRG